MLLLSDMAKSGPKLQLRVMSGLVALLQAGSVLMSHAPGTTEGSDTKDQGPS